MPSQRSAVFQQLLSKRFENEAPDIEEIINTLINKEAGMEPSATEDVEETCLQALLSLVESVPSLVPYVALGYPDLCAELARQLGSVRTVVLKLYVLLSTVSAPGLQIDDESVKDLLNILLNTNADKERTILICRALGQASHHTAMSVSSQNRILSETKLWEFAASKWDFPEEYTELMGLLATVVGSASGTEENGIVSAGFVHSDSDLTRRILDMAENIGTHGTYSAADFPRINAFLSLMVAGYLKQRNQETQEQLRKRLVHVVKAAETTLTLTEHCRQDYYSILRLLIGEPKEEEACAHVKDWDAIELKEKLDALREMCPLSSHSTENVKRYTTALQKVFPSTCTPFVCAAAASFFPTIILTLNECIIASEFGDHRGGETGECCSTLHRMIVSCALSSCSLQSFYTVQSPSAAFLSYRGTLVLEHLLHSEENDHFRVGCEILSALLKMHPTSHPFRLIVLASQCLSLLELYLHKVAEAENTNECISCENTRACLQSLGRVVENLRSEEVRFLSMEMIPDFATIIAQSLTFPALVQQCFNATAAMAGEYAYAASMILDYDFIMEQFSIMDTPSECNMHIITGSLQVMTAMVHRSPEVITFEWIEVLARAIELLPLLEGSPNFSPTLWRCVVRTLQASEEYAELVLTSEIQKHIAEAVRRAQDPETRCDIIRVASFIQPRNADIDAAIMAILDEENIRLSGTLVDEIAMYFTLHDHNNDTVLEKGEETRALIINFFLDLLQKLDSFHQSTILEKISVHEREFDAVGSSLASYGAAPTLLQVASSETTEDRILLAAALFWRVLSTLKTSPSHSSDISHCTINAMEDLLEKKGRSSTSPLLYFLSGALQVLFSHYGWTDADSARLLMRSSLAQRVLEVKKDGIQCLSTIKENMLDCLGHAIIISQYSGVQIVDTQPLMSVVKGFVLTASSSAEKKFLHLLLNYDEVRAACCAASVIEQYESALLKLQEDPEGSPLAIALYLDELRELKK